MPWHPPHQLDLKGLKCPMPVIKVQQAARNLAPGSQLEVLVTDPAAEKDLASWCRINKHDFISCAIFAPPEPQVAPAVWQIKLKLKDN